MALDVVARLIETNTSMMAPRRHRVVLSHPMPLDTARLATLGLTVAMPLPATWTGVAVDRTAAPAPSAPDASVGTASDARHRSGGRSPIRRSFPSRSRCPKASTW